MKKVLALMLCLVFALTTLSGCGEKKDPPTTGTDVTKAPTEAGSDASAEGSKEIVEIFWQYPTTGNLGSGFQDMEDALNEMMERDIGVHVTFVPTGLMDSQQKAMLMVSAEEPLDICLTAFTSIGPLVSGEMIIPLDELQQQYGKGLEEVGTNLLKGYYKGQLYGIPPVEMAGQGYGYLIKNKFAEKYGITLDEEKLYTLEDLEKIFEIVKAGEGSNFYCNIPWNTTPEPANNGYIAYDKIGGSLAHGVLMLNRSFSDLTVYNLFETEEYKTYAETMYRWAQKGYLSPDAAITTEAPDTLAATDNYLGVFYFGGPTAAQDYSTTAGTEMTKLNMVEPYAVNAGGAVVQWSITINSEHPEKAMEAINYLYTHDEANYIVQYGLEGQSYEVLEKTENGMQIKYLSDDMASLPYFNPYGLWGNQLHYPGVAPTSADKGKIMEEYSKAIPQSKYSPAMGYNFIQDDVATEVAAVETVIAQYTPSINSGALDPAKSLPDFISALKSAGIDTIIAENQKQLDAWAASK